MGTQKTLTPIISKKNLKDAENFLGEMHVDVMARTLWGEARSEGVKGMEAVAHVILNRVKYAKNNGGKFWWGHDVTTVCQRPYQFSCWNHSDPNRARIIALDSSDIHFQTCVRVARRAIYGGLGRDMTKGATHYHTFHVNPIWSRDIEPVTIVGGHKFYDLKGQ
ncbi:MAG: hydrolase [Alphaproteobacteria bacterium]|nr:MAG: hydrolase [Alphaproteobacteria bacterium]